MTADTGELPDMIMDFPGLRLCRVFGADGKGIPAVSCTAIGTLLDAGITPWVSFKDWPSDNDAYNMLTDWLDTVDFAVGLVYHHEPENNFGTAGSTEFRYRWTLFADWVRAHPNAHLVSTTAIHTLYAARYKASDSYDPDPATWIGAPGLWRPVLLDDSYAPDSLGFDCYQVTTATSYEAPNRFFATAVAAAHAAGAPLVIPELGALRIPGDEAGHGRAALITACLGYLHERGCQAVAWWNTDGSAGHDYRLRDTPSADAWQAAIATYNT